MSQYKICLNSYENTDHDLDEKHERKIKQFLEGRTLLCQLLKEGM